MMVDHKYELEGCIVLNEHNTVFAQSGLLYVIGSFPGPTWVLNANGISIALEFSAGLIRWQTNRQTDRPRYRVIHSRRYLST